MAKRNAEITRMRMNIYLYHETWIIIPHGYNMHDQAVLLGYVTSTGVFESGNDDEATKENSIGRN